MISLIIDGLDQQFELWEKKEKEKIDKKID